VESVTRSLVDGMRALGHDAEVVSWFDEAPVTFPDSLFGWLRSKLERARARSRAADRAAEKLRRDLLDDPDLVVLLDPGSLPVAERLSDVPRWGIHLHWSPDLLLRPWLHVAGEGIPRVLRPLVSVRLRVVAERNRAVLGAAPFVVALAPSHTRTLRGLRDHVTELPNPARLEISPPRGLVNLPRVHIGYLGRLSYEKGPDVFVEAAAVLGSADLVWTIGGTGPFEEALRERIAKLDAPVRTVGWVEDTHAFLEAIDVFVLPSRTEAVPLVLAEALAAGCQVVATDAGEGVRDVLGDGYLGRIVPVDDVPSLAAAVTAAAADARAGAHPDREGVARLIMRHDPERVLHAWERLVAAQVAPRA
jgi:glycosyltransferase involved in cell wall biosynthesis